VGVLSDLCYLVDLYILMPMSGISDAQAMKSAREQEQDSLHYNLARTDYFLKLLENHLAEVVDLEVTAKGIFPQRNVIKLDPSQEAKLQGNLDRDKKMLLEKLGIHLP